MTSTTGKCFFTSDELSVLQRAFDLACADLRLSFQRPPMREQLGALIFELAAAGEIDCAALRRLSVQRFRGRFAEYPIEVGHVGVLSFARARKSHLREHRGRR